MSFILENQDADKNIDKKIYIMQILFNYIFEKNYQTYKRKVKFYIPIKFFISSKIKIIDTDFTISYENSLHFIHSNCPIAPRDNGGYYIAVTDIDKFLHILSYDKNDNLINDLNTTEKAFPFEITATDYGLATYVQEADSSYHSYKI